MAQSVWGGTGAPPPPLEYICLDRSWTKLLPRDSKIISAVGHGSSYWSQTGKIEVRLADKSTKRYFIKLSETHIGRAMVEGEYESTKALYEMDPVMIPRPIGWGTYESSSDLHFFICDHVGIHDEIQPDKADFCKRLAELNLKSQDKSPNGLYGFHVTTCNAVTPQYVKWTVSWEEFFIETLRDCFDLDESPTRQGPCPELAALKAPLFEKVCPRLLRPIETGGNSIRPALLHGDVWHGNTARQVDNGAPLLFDPSAIWGHHEFELHSWQGGRYLFGHDHINEYFKHFPASEPKEDFHDRLELYRVVSDMHDSIAFPQTDKFRKQCIERIQALVDKFPEGYTGPCKKFGENIGDKIPDNATARLDSVADTGENDNMVKPEISIVTASEKPALMTTLDSGYETESVSAK